MTLPVTVTVRHLQNIQPFPRAVRRKIAAGLGECGLFPSNLDYDDDSAFYAGLLALYARGPAAFTMVDNVISAISPRRRLAASFLDRTLALSGRAIKELQDESVALTLTAIAKQTLPHISLDALWIAWLYGTNVLEIRKIIEFDADLHKMVGDWPIHGSETLSEFQLVIDQKANVEAQHPLKENQPITKEGLGWKLDLLLEGLKRVRANAHADDNARYPVRLAEAHRRLELCTSSAWDDGESLRRDLEKPIHPVPSGSRVKRACPSTLLWDLRSGVRFSWRHVPTTSGCACHICSSREKCQLGG